MRLCAFSFGLVVLVNWARAIAVVLTSVALFALPEPASARVDEQPADEKSAKGAVQNPSGTKTLSELELTASGGDADRSVRLDENIVVFSDPGENVLGVLTDSTAWLGSHEEKLASDEIGFLSKSVVDSEVGTLQSSTGFKRKSDRGFQIYTSRKVVKRETQTIVISEEHHFSPLGHAYSLILISDLGKESRAAKIAAQVSDRFETLEKGAPKSTSHWVRALIPEAFAGELGRSGSKVSPPPAAGDAGISAECRGVQIEPPAHVRRLTDLPLLDLSFKSTLSPSLAWGRLTSCLGGQIKGFKSGVIGALKAFIPHQSSALSAMGVTGWKNWMYRYNPGSAPAVMAADLFYGAGRFASRLYNSDANTVLAAITTAASRAGTRFTCLSNDDQVHLLCEMAEEIGLEVGMLVAGPKIGPEKMAAKLSEFVEKKVASRLERVAGETGAGRRLANGEAAAARIGQRVEPPIKESELVRFTDENERAGSTRKGFERGLQHANEHLGYLVETSGRAPLFHGSRSSSLLGLLKRGERAGLKPTGELLKEGDVPFSGELALGSSSRGVNMTNLSTVKISDLDMAVRYANRKGAAYSASAGQAQLARLRGLLPWERELYANRIEIETRRLEKWKQLSSQERALVTGDFPVLYALKPAAQRGVTVFKTDIGDLGGGAEVGLRGGASTSEISAIYVPANQVAKTQAMLNQAGNPIRVYAIEPVTTAMKSGLGH